MTKSTITREQQRQILIDTAKHIISRERTSPYSENLRELARIALAAMDSEPVLWAWQHLDMWHVTSHHGRARDLGLSGFKVIPLYLHAQPAPVSLTEYQVAALEGGERSFHDAIRKCIASLRYHHKRAEAHSAGYKGSTLEDDTLKSINFLKRNITAAMLNGGKP